MIFYKAVRPDGTDFYTGTVRWAPEQGEIPEGGIIVTHPTSTVWGESHATHLCASVAPTGCEGFGWPCRLLEVEPASEMHEHAGTKVSALSWRVVRELPATQAFGPQGAAVAALIDGLRLRRLTAAQGAALAAAPIPDREVAWDASRVAARRASRVAAWDAAEDAEEDAIWLAGGRAAWAAWDAWAAWAVARGTAAALVVWDLITPDHRDILTEPIRTALPDLWAEVSSRLPDIR